MKKLLMFLCCVLMMNGALAGCKVLTCDRNGDFINGWARTHVGGTQCWWCGPGPNSCNNHDIVSVKDEVGDVVWLYQCNMGLVSNKFSNFTPDEYCADSPLKNKQAENAKVTYSVKDYAKTSKSEFGDWYLNDGSASCIYVKCNEGYGPSADKQSCVLIKESDCEKGGGNWIGGVCSCSQGPDYVWKESEKKCDLTDAARKAQKDAEDAARRAQEQARTKREACEQSGGKFQNNKCTCDADKNLVASGNGCACKSSDYQFIKDSKSCAEKDESVRRRKCESASDAYWDATALECVCNGADMVFVYGKGQCVESADAALCKAAKDTTWNSTTKECKCKKAGYEFVDGKCEESAESIRQREEEAKKQRITQSTAIIGNASQKLDEIMAGLKVSVWKSAEGKFNTARLASDSIAGVVLGTAGGLITSHVVKKNQVKKGFEDIQCVVGGQKVADWADEFTVGIR